MTTTSISIMSRKDADRAIKGGNFDAVVSINDADGARPPFHVRNFAGPKLVLHFDDVEHDGADRHGYVAPMSGDAGRILRFAERHADRWLIHCHAGVSRSSAAAMIIAHAKGMDPLSVLDDSWHWPNLLLLRLADQQTGSELEAVASAWRHRISSRGVSL